jgi:hypothetical protein
MVKRALGGIAPGLSRMSISCILLGVERSGEKIRLRA